MTATALFIHRCSAYLAIIGALLHNLGDLFDTLDDKNGEIFYINLFFVIFFQIQFLVSVLTK